MLADMKTQNCIDLSVALADYPRQVMAAQGALA
jgi:hypothetical protein